MEIVDRSPVIIRIQTINISKRGLWYCVMTQNPNTEPSFVVFYQNQGQRCMKLPLCRVNLRWFDTPTAPTRTAPTPRTRENSLESSLKCRTLNKVDYAIADHRCSK